MLVQALLTRFTEEPAETISNNLLDKIKKNCIVQIIGTPCMIGLNLIMYRISSRSSKLMKQLNFFRMVLLIGYNELSLEATVIPLGNAGISLYSALSAIIFVELLFLNIGFMLVEPLGILNFLPLAFTNIMLAARLQYLPISCMVFFILAVLALVLGYFQNCTIERRLIEKTRLSQHSGEIYQSFMNLLPEGVAILSDEQQLKYVNTSMSRILGCNEEDILTCLLSLQNTDAVGEGENDTKKGDFQKKLTKRKSGSARFTGRFAKTMNHLKNPLQTDDVNFSIIEINNDKPTPEKNELPKFLYPKPGADLIKNYHQRAMGQYGRAQTFDTLGKDSGRASFAKELQASNSIRQEVNSGGEESNMDKDKSEDKESILRSQRQTPQNPMEPQNLVVPNLFGDDDIERPSGGNENSVSSGQGSFVKKRTFQLEKRHTPDISFVGQMRGIGTVGISQSVLPSQPSYFKVIPSQILSPQHVSNDVTPKNSNGASDNVMPQKSIQQPSQVPSPQNKQEQEEQQKPNGEPDFQGNSSSKGSQVAKLKSVQTMQTLTYSGKQSGTTRHGTLFEETSPLRHTKKLTSYVTKLKDLKSAYLSIMKKLKQDSAGIESSSHTQERKGWTIASVINSLRKMSCLKRKTGEPAPEQEKNKKDEEVKFNLKEENCCVVMNSKLKVRESFEKVLEVSLTPTLLNNVPYLLVLVKDRTERDLINRLRDTNNYKNTIMATVSHELRTPLNCIISMLDGLRQNIDEELANKYLVPATNSSKLLLCMINDILDFGQICAGMHRHYYDMFSLREVLLDTLTLFEVPAKSRGLELKFEWDSKIPHLIYSDPSRICQIVTNLLNNAIKFTYKGSITLKTVYKGAQMVRIMVIDTGIGIKSEDVKKIFQAEDEYFNSHGVGIGLKISQSLAYRLGPKDKRGIKVRSEYGKGTCFFFTVESRLPQKKMPIDMQDHTSEVSSRAENRDKSQLNVLEDNKEIEEFKVVEGDEHCEIDDTSSDETMRLGYNMVLLNRMNQLGKPGKTIGPPVILPFGILNQDIHSSIQSESNLDGLPVYEAADIARMQQRALEAVSMHLNHLQLPLNANGQSPVKVPSKLNFSFLPRDIRDGEQNSRQSPILEPQASPSQLEDFLLSGQPKSMLMPKTLDSAHFRKPSADGSLGLQSEQKSKNNLLGNSFDEKRKASNDIASSVDFLKVLKSSSDAAGLLANSHSHGSLKTPKSSFSFQHQKNCKCEELLIVDDNDFNLLALSELLDSFQFRVAKAYNGEIAINMIKEKAKSNCCNAFLIVFMDCDMPVKDGFETTKELRALQKKKLLPTFPIIAVTAFVNEREIKRCFESGMDEVLNKPVKKDKIQEVVKKWCK